MYTTIIFDLGGVLIDWNPVYLYKKIFDKESDMTHFLTEVCTPEWNEEQDAGRTLQEATEELVNRFPVHEKLIRVLYERWEEMLGGELEGTVQILKELLDQGEYKIYALTNWSAETFPIAMQKFPFLHWFDGIVVSGTEKMRKPHKEFYQLLLDRYRVKAGEAIFIDDNTRNIKAAEVLGIDAIAYEDPGQLRNELRVRGIL
jgi:2-haloacid dehalogenase